MTSFECDAPDVGLTVFFTGLPGAGKSATACILRDNLLKMPGQTVMLLDGDTVRQKLSPELGFSRADRDENIRRIGRAAAEAARRGEVVICASIAPYDSARKMVRQMTSVFGRFFLVYLSTPLAVCEARDRRGLYARARAGVIPQFTGISDPYEPPADAEIVIDTTHTSAEAAADIIMKRLPLHLAKR